MSSEDDVARALASSVSRVSGASGAAAADASAAVKMPRNAGGSRGCPGCFVAGTLIALLGADAEAIENIRVGDRVQTTQSSSVTAVDSSWRLVELEGVSSGELEESLHVRLLRSPASLEAHGVSGSGDHVYLKLKELGFEGWLRVVGIQDAPEISSGPGRVVLSTFTRLSNDVYEVGFVGGAVLRGTGGHPLWSLDRDDWVSVRDLQVGERLQTAEGAVSVEALEKVRGLHRVYNLEVEGDHEYLVGEAGVRAHNQSACGDVTVFRVQPVGESSHVTGGVFARLRERGSGLLRANGERHRLLRRVGSADANVRRNALAQAQGGGRSSPFISTTFDEAGALSQLRALEARGINAELLTIRGPRAGGADFNAALRSLGGRTKRFGDADLLEFGIPDLFIPSTGASRSGFSIVLRTR